MLCVWKTYWSEVTTRGTIYSIAAAGVKANNQIIWVLNIDIKAKIKKGANLQTFLMIPVELCFCFHSNSIFPAINLEIPANVEQ